MSYAEIPAFHDRYRDGWHGKRLLLGELLWTYGRNTHEEGLMHVEVWDRKTQSFVRGIRRNMAADQDRTIEQQLVLYDGFVEMSYGVAGGTLREIRVGTPAQITRVDKGNELHDGKMVWKIDMTNLTPRPYFIEPGKNGQEETICTLSTHDYQGAAPTLGEKAQGILYTSGAILLPLRLLQNETREWYLETASDDMWKDTRRIYYQTPMDVYALDGLLSTPKRPDWAIEMADALHIAQSSLWR